MSVEFDKRGEHGPFDIVGDVHGCYDELVSLLIKLNYVQQGETFGHPQGRQVIFLGDLGDRGPHCLKSIKFVMDMVHAGKALYVPGNHCNKLYKFLLGRNVQVKYGLEKTVAELDNLNSLEREIFSNEFKSFFASSAPYLMLDDGKLVVSHAGIRSDMIGRLNKRIKEFCLYGDPTGEVTPEGLPVRRDWAKNYRGKALVVYGHTPVAELKFKNNTIDIDTGCAMGGKLTALRYPEREFVQVPAGDVYYVRPESRSLAGVK